MAKESLNCEIDRISDLPVDVTHNILAFLPLRESARTSVLSSKWRYRWNNLSKLVFDDNVCQFAKDDDDHLKIHKLISTINQILLLHDGPILEFSLSHFALESCPAIDHIISFLSKNGVREFSLQILKGQNHKLHSSFFSCRDLTHMNLWQCIFTLPPGFKGFNRLVSLKFVNVAFSTDGFDNFISSCPQLERLTLINPPEFHCFALSAMNLKYLHFEGECDFLRFGDVPLLQSVSLVMGFDSLRGEKTCKLVEFFGCLPALKKLFVNYRLLQHLAQGVVPKKLPTSIGLETLKLSKISFQAIDEVSSTFCLISSCPCIKTIEICFVVDDAGDIDEVVEFLKTQDYAADIILDELREVTLKFVTGIEPELEFIKHLLAKSPALETLVIKPNREDIHSSFELVTKLTRFKRASSMAEIIFG